MVSTYSNIHHDYRRDRTSSANNRAIESQPNTTTGFTIRKVSFRHRVMGTTCSANLHKHVSAVKSRHFTAVTTFMCRIVSKLYPLAWRQGSTIITGKAWLSYPRSNSGNYAQLHMIDITLSLSHVVAQVIAREEINGNALT